MKQEGLFGIPFEILWRDLEACEEGRMVCWKELRTLGTSGEEIKEPTKWNKVFYWESGSERDSGAFGAKIGISGNLGKI